MPSKVIILNKSLLSAYHTTNAQQIYHIDMSMIYWSILLDLSP